MTCHCDNLQRNPNVTLLYEKLAKQLLEKNLEFGKIDFKTLLKLTQWSNSLNPTLIRQADAIIKPLIKAVQDYNNPFKYQVNKALAQVNEVSKNNTLAISIFTQSIDTIKKNITQIEQLILDTQTQLNEQRANTAQEISHLGSQIQQLETEQRNLKTKIKLLQDEINLLSKQINDLNWAWLACIIIILCPWLPILIQEVALNKSQKEQDLNQKILQLNQANKQLTNLKSNQENLKINYTICMAILTSTQNANRLCLYLLNNISGILDALKAIDMNETPTMLRRMLSVLNQNWDDLLSEINLLAATSDIN